MDQALSALIPIERTGHDGFSWWVGQIEGTASDEANNKGGYRYKVRIIGDHPQDKSLLQTSELPWANVMMPVNVPFMPGNIGGGDPQLVEGCWVIGFYMDNMKQKPLILGSIGQTPGSTTVVKNVRPDDPGFTHGTRSGAYAPNPAKDGQESPENREGGESDKTAKTGGGQSDGSTDGNGNQRVPGPNVNDPKLVKSQEEWCQEVAEKCKDVDLKTQMTGIVSGMLATIQENDGQLGTFYVNKVTGGLNEAVGQVRTQINKANLVVSEFIARVKGYIKTKLAAGVNDLTKALLRQDETGNSLTPVTEWFNNLLKDLNCQMEDLGTRLAEWLTNVLMSYINQIYQAIACQIDELVNGIMSKINQLMSELLSSILGPLQEILGAIAEPLNILGDAINFVLKLLGISCSGPDTTCAKYKKVCTTGEKKKDDDDKNFLDDLLGDIDNLFGDTPADYTQYVCDDAYKGKSLDITTVGFTGGVPALGTGNNTKPIIKYNIGDITVSEGETATFTVTRSGFTEEASSINYKTLNNQGSATTGVDYQETSGILGFAPNETSKTIPVQTLYNDQAEPSEDFFISLSKNSPQEGSGISTNFIKNIGKCTITESNVTSPDDGDQYLTQPSNPLTPIPDVPDNTINFPSTPVSGVDETTNTTPTYNITANRSFCPEGEFIIYTITTTNVVDGTVLFYTLNGTGITSGDIVGGQLTGQIIITDNQAKVTVGIEDDDVVEDAETLRFTLNGKGVFADVLITTADDLGIDDYDTGTGETPENTYREFEFPTIDPSKIITDENGGIIEIPVDKPGDPWAEPPYVFIGGEGIGAVGTALLDGDGFLTEIRLQSNGFGYKKNLAKDQGVRCIVDAFTILRPGVGYTEVPDLYVNGELGVAEAVINDDGFVIGARMLDRTRTFDRFPAIDIIGGGGYGAKLLPSLACLDTDALATVGSTRIGTGEYIDCP